MEMKDFTSDANDESGARLRKAAETVRALDERLTSVRAEESSSLAALATAKASLVELYTADPGGAAAGKVERQIEEHASAATKASARLEALTAAHGKATKEHAEAEKETRESRLRSALVLRLSKKAGLEAAFVDAMAEAMRCATGLEQIEVEGSELFNALDADGSRAGWNPKALVEKAEAKLLTFFPDAPRISGILRRVDISLSMLHAHAVPKLDDSAVAVGAAQRANRGRLFGSAERPVRDLTLG